MGITREKPPLRILNLGWGIQSFTMAAMAALGELPTVGAAVHADTTHEMSATYDFARRWTPWLESRGVRVVTVRDEPSANSFRHSDGINMPLYTINQRGEKGQMNRSCTQRWKIAPIRRFVSELLRCEGTRKAEGCVEQWLGISTDEADRMKPSDVKYIHNRFPLLETGMSRADCVSWLESRKLEVPPKSACKQCPYHSREVWKAMERNAPQDFAYAVEIDRLIRNKRPGFQSFLSDTRRPLGQSFHEFMAERGQGSLFEGDANECTGNCFL